MKQVRRIRDRCDHRWTQRRVSDYLDGDMNERHQRRLRAHAALCPDCAPMLRSLTIVLWELRELRRGPQPPTITPRVIERLREEATKRQPSDGQPRS